MDRRQIVAEIKRTAAENNGQPLGIARFQEATGIKTSDWQGKYWIRWNDALREAGYAPNRMQPSYDEQWLLERLASLVQELGHFPVRAEIQLKRRSDETFPSYKAFHSRFGEKPSLVRKLSEYCSLRPEYQNVVKICQRLCIAKTPDDDRPSMGKIPYGFVYLLKSGRYYKIGRSNSVGRREYELGIQLPEPPKTIHKIKTDDPIGIEAYWHQRFDSKRRHGEWFELSRDDVQAFGRRKFM